MVGVSKRILQKGDEENMVTLEEAYDIDPGTADILVQNGMFRNREYNGLPISGSDADTCRYDDEEYRVYAEMAGMRVCPVVIIHV